MTLYMLLVALGAFIYTGMAIAENVVAESCVGQCVAAEEAITATARLISPDGSQAVVVAAGSAPAGTAGIFGGPVPEDSCSAQILED